MANRDVVLDGTIIDELNRGNSDLAKVLNHLRSTGARLWMPVSEHFGRPEADKRLIRDLGIQVPAIDNNATPPRIPAGVPGAKAIVAQLAVTLNGHVMSMDEAFMRAMPRNRVVANMLTIRPRIGPRDYNEARRLVKLKPLNIGNDGKVIRPAPRPPERPLRTADTPTRQVPRDSAGTPILRSTRVAPMEQRTGQPDKVPQKDRPANIPSAVHQTGVKFVFQGVNYVIQAINDEIQKQRFEKRWAELRPGVEAALNAEPSLGALVLVYYYKRTKTGAEKETPMDHTNAFKDIRIAYGLTKEDALANFGKRDQINTAGAGDVSIDDSTFIPPRLPVDFTKLDLEPFQAEGLATFVPGKEAFLNMRWTGFNREFRRSGETSFKPPANLELRFLFLSPPSEIDYRDNTSGKFETEEIDWKYVDPGEKAQAFGTHFPGVPALGVGSAWFNQFDSAAALFAKGAVPVFPVNATTAGFFARQRILWDDYGELAHIPLFRKVIRFVLPHRLRVLQYFGA